MVDERGRGRNWSECSEQTGDCSSGEQDTQCSEQFSHGVAQKRTCAQQRVRLQRVGVQSKRRMGDPAPDDLGPLDSENSEDDSVELIKHDTFSLEETKRSAAPDIRQLSPDQMEAQSGAMRLIGTLGNGVQYAAHLRALTDEYKTSNPQQHASRAFVEVAFPSMGVSVCVCEWLGVYS